jgi:hypothetical protein
MKLPTLAPIERWTRGQLVDYLYGCVHESASPLYRRAFLEALEDQPTEKLLAMVRSAAEPRIVNRRRRDAQTFIASADERSANV